MQLDEKVNLLKHLSIFKGLAIADLEHIANSTIEKTFEPGEVFIEQGTSASNAYIIYSGSARVFLYSEDGEEIALNILGPGEMVGEMSLLDNEPRSANVAALQKTDVLILTHDSFIKILKSYPELAIELLKTLSLRVRAADKRMEDILSKNLHQRTWKTLLSLSNYFPQGGITLSQEELATIIGATRARVTEVLNQLQHEGKVTLSHRNIKILQS